MGGIYVKYSADNQMIFASPIFNSLKIRFDQWRIPIYFTKIYIFNGAKNHLPQLVKCTYLRLYY